MRSGRNRLARAACCVALAVGLQACQSGPSPRDVEQEPPAMTNTPAPSYSAAPFLALVERYAEEGGASVDYAAWQASSEDMTALDEHIALLAQVSPDSHPDQFPLRGQQRSYWINAYNALVLDAILELWPLDSVRDVKLSLSSRVIPGKGFFYDRKVVVGGEETNLYDLEKQVLRTQKDPRLHFALNCGSESCPVIRPWEWTDQQLDRAAREFVNDVRNVSVGDDEVRVSEIFRWYKRDFPDDLPAYLAQYADSPLRERLLAAGEADYRVRYFDYDWSLNNAEQAGEGEQADG